MLLMMQWRMKVMKKKGNTLLTLLSLCNPFSALLEVPASIFWTYSTLQNKSYRSVWAQHTRENQAADSETPMTSCWWISTSNKDFSG
jgi:hypothetical protein